MFNRFACLFLLAALLLTVLPTAAESTATAEPTNTQPQAVFLGDSIATGYLLEDYDSQAYAALLSETLGAVATNLAVNGATSGDLLTALETERYQRAVEAADFIFISIGGNNFLRRLADWVSAIPGELPSDFAAVVDDGVAAFEKEFPAILRTLKAQNPAATIVVQTIYNPYAILRIPTGDGLLCDYLERQINRLNLILRAVHLKNPAAFLLSDVAKAFKEAEDPQLCNSTLVPFNLDPHPSAKGHRLIADTLLATLEKEGFVSVVSPLPSSTTTAVLPASTVPSTLTSTAPAQPQQPSAAFPWIPVGISGVLLIAVILVLLKCRFRRR